MHIEYFYVTQSGKSDSHWIYLDEFEFPNGYPKESYISLLNDLLDGIYNYSIVTVTYWLDIINPIECSDIIGKNVWLPSYRKLKQLNKA